MLLEDLTAIVLWLLLAVASLNFVFLCFLAWRRYSRKRYFRLKDAARLRFRDAVGDFSDGKLTPTQAAAALSRAGTRAEQDAVQEMLMALLDRASAPRMTQLFYELGYIESWARITFGRSRGRALMAAAVRGEKPQIDPGRVRGGWLNWVRGFRILAVPRALAMDHLGRLDPAFALHFAAEALHDPAAIVRQVAVYTMGHIRHPAAIPLLLQEMERAIGAQNDVSLRTTKTTLVCYKMEDLPYFLPSLQHSQWRMRFFVIDSMREIARLADKASPLTAASFPPGVCDAVVDRAAVDKYPDVRARAAALMGLFRDARSTEALRRLLQDENEFVRLHAVRAVADPAYFALVPDLLARIGDTKWRVREAATKSLAQFGRAAVDQLYAAFVQSSDQYVSEQIADEIQRLGLLSYVLGSLAAAQDGQLARAVCQKFALLGKTSLLTTALASGEVPLPARLALIDTLAIAPTEAYWRVLERISHGDRGPLGERAQTMLNSPAGKKAVSGESASSFGASGGVGRA